MRVLLVFVLSTCSSFAASPKSDATERSVACEQGDAAACGALGGMHLVGAGVPVDNEKAVKLLTLGCDGGDLKSCTDLGALHLSGTGVPANGPVAATYFKAACERGWPSACHYLAVQHLLGNGVERDMAKAIALNENACKGGVAAACGHIGGVYKLGYGVEPDLERSLHYRSLACDGGELFSCALLGAALHNGTGLPADPQRAADILINACRGNEPTACFELGQMVANGTAPTALGTDPDGMYQRAMEIALPPCQAGDSNACMVAKDILRVSGTAEQFQTFCSDLGPAVSKGCNEGVFTACVDLIQLHTEGCGVPNTPEAVEVAKRQACALGVQLWCTP